MVDFMKKDASVSEQSRSLEARGGDVRAHSAGQPAAHDPELTSKNPREIHRPQFRL